MPGTSNRYICYIDGLSIVMRPAMVATTFDGSPVLPAEAANIAWGMVQRWIPMMQTTHHVWAFDHPSKNWREFVYPAYKAHRETDTTPYAEAMMALVVKHRRTRVVQVPGYEADDCIATMVGMATEPVAVLTIDSDYFQMLRPGVTLFRPQTQGRLDVWDDARVCEHHDIANASLYADWKALVGDKADGIPGVKGIGPKKASALLRKHGDLLRCVQSGDLGAEAANAMLWQSLIKLRQDVPGCLPARAALVA